MKDFQDFGVFVFGISANSKTRKTRRILQASITKTIHSVLICCLPFTATVFTLLPTDSEQKNKVRRISKISAEVFVSSTGANSKTRKTRKILQSLSYERNPLSSLPSRQPFSRFSQLNNSQQKNKVRKISEISESSVFGIWTNSKKHRNSENSSKLQLRKTIHSVLICCLPFTATVFTLLPADSEQKNKVRRISKISAEVFVSSTGANSKTRKILQSLSMKEIHSVVCLLGNRSHASRN